MSISLRLRFTFANDVHPLAAVVYMCIKLHSAKYPDLAPIQLPDPRQPARSSPTFSRLSLLFLVGASLTTFRLCTRIL